MTYLSVLHRDLREKLLYYFHLPDIVYYVDNVREFSYLANKPEISMISNDSEYFWRGIYQTFYSSSPLTYQNKLRHLAKLTHSLNDVERATLAFVGDDFNGAIKQVNTRHYLKHCFENAIKFDNMPAITYCIEKGLDVTISHLIYACLNGDITLVMFLVENYKDNINYDLLLYEVLYHKNMTHVSSYTIVNCQSIIKYLIAKGANPTIITAEQRGIFHL